MHPLRLLMVVLAVLCFGLPTAEAKKSRGSDSSRETYVKGYTRKDGTQVAPHYRSKSNNTRNDNWGTVGNVNPYTGKAGTKPRDTGAGTSAGTYNPTSNYITTTRETSTATRPTQQAPSTVASSSGQSQWNALRVGMSKDEVMNLMGAPNMKTDRKWLYTEGGWIRFDQDRVAELGPK